MNRPPPSPAPRPTFRRRQRLRSGIISALLFALLFALLGSPMVMALLLLIILCSVAGPVADPTGGPGLILPPAGPGLAAAATLLTHSPTGLASSTTAAGRLAQAEGLLVLLVALLLTLLRAVSRHGQRVADRR